MPADFEPGENPLPGSQLLSSHWVLVRLSQQDATSSGLEPDRLAGDQASSMAWTQFFSRLEKVWKGR